MTKSTPATVHSMIVATIALCAIISYPVSAQQTGNRAEEVANEAIARLAGWQNQTAREILERNRDVLGSSPEFKTAWALLEIQDGAGKNKNNSNQGEKSLGQLSANGASSGSTAYFHGEALYLKGDKNGANASWQKAANLAGTRVAAKATDATAQFYRGASLVRLKKFDDARTALLIAVRGGFDPAMVNHQIGLSHLYGGQWQPAKDAFDIGLAVNPQFAPMYFWRAMASEKLGRKDNMLIDLDQFVKLAPNSPEAGKARSILKSAGR